VRAMILNGFREHAYSGPVSPEILATTVSWAIYGAAKEWLQTPQRNSADEFAETVVRLVSPIFLVTEAI
jgi:hypothetical protein